MPVNRIRNMGGMVYYPAYSNIQSFKIGSRAKIHSHVWIAHEVIIGDDAKIQAFVFIPNGVTIGDRVFLGPRVTFTNDKYPPSDTVWNTIVGNDVVIGAGVVVLPGLTIGDGAKIGAGSVVTKDVAPGSVVCGNPAREITTTYNPFDGQQSFDFSPALG